MKSMKKLLTLLAILVTFNAYSQNTTTLPTPTTSFAPSFRYYGTLLDSLRQTWVQTPGGGWNRWYTATEMSSLLAAKTNKLQNVVNADDYTDTFTGWNADGFNHGSAIWQILNGHSFANVKIILSNKTYVPVVNAVTYLTLNNVAIAGTKAPAFTDGLASLVGGTIIQGNLNIVQPSADLYFENFGTDAGKTVSDTYYSGVDVSGLTLSFQSGITAWGRNVVMNNITALMRSPTAIGHPILVEHINGGYLNNIRTCFGIYGPVIKSTDIKIGKIESFANSTAGLYIKAGDGSNTNKISVDDFVFALLPPEATTSWVTIPTQARAILLDAQAFLSDIRIGSAQIDGAGFGVSLSASTGYTLRNVAIGSLLLKNCDRGISRYNPGTISNIQFGSVKTENNIDEAINFQGGAGLDSAIKIDNLIITRSDAAQTPDGIYMLDNTVLEIGTANFSKVVNATNITSGRLILNNYTLGSNVTNYIASGKVSPLRTNLTSLSTIPQSQVTNLTSDLASKYKSGDNVTFGNGFFAYSTTGSTDALKIGDGLAHVYASIRPLAGNQGFINFFDGVTQKFSIGKQTDNSLVIYDNVAVRNALKIVSNGDVSTPVNFTALTLNSTATQTTVAGSTSGSIVASQPFQGASFKKVMIRCNSLSGTATYTFPTPFIIQPEMITNGSLVSALSTTSVTVNNAATAWVILEGY